ncbi:hypothetical protein B0T25DRAFT_528314 [Lasiosphaeria hispida]|uniref:Uncharacterized protein n=1 Tax=Lasiosphaeria hispida TaxID=260671 RepID=A0AAJ0HW91_9PEZI|nr:hypothetical protein B0T25DRAFT_528314 [Lasiosphaeria hispida]
MVVENCARCAALSFLTDPASAQPFGVRGIEKAAPELGAWEAQARGCRIDGRCHTEVQREPASGAEDVGRGQVELVDGEDGRGGGLPVLNRRSMSSGSCTGERGATQRQEGLQCLDRAWREVELQPHRRGIGVGGNEPHGVTVARAGVRRVGHNQADQISNLG